MSPRRRQSRAAIIIMTSARPPTKANSGRISTLNPATKASAASKDRDGCLAGGGRDGLPANGRRAAAEDRHCALPVPDARNACDQQTIIHHSRPRYASTKPFSRPEVAKSRAGGTAM